LVDNGDTSKGSFMGCTMLVSVRVGTASFFREMFVGYYGGKCNVVRLKGVPVVSYLQSH